MPILGIDIETYSEVDLPKCGVYAYAEHPSFEILLFAYAFDDEETQVVDLKCGERLPPRVLDALADPAITKTAFNAAFERTCIGRYLGRRLDAAQWQCTAVQSAMLALPLSLEGVGEVLGIERKKLKEGGDLVRYFSLPCKPTKANGQRTRNLPEHAPEKWQRFKEYCVRDVDAEREIRAKLQGYPIPAKEQELYRLDQEINDRGIMVDPVLVARAIECDEQYREKTTKRAYELTGLANPNSPAQLKEWLEGQGTEVDTLDKKAVRALLPDAEGDVLEVLKLRLLMAKTSVKKYEAIRRSVCADGRVHGLLQFYGANRTGRWAGRLVQIQNLPQNHIPDLALARDLVKAGRYADIEALYESTPNVLSELIRTAFVPRPGCRFIVADFSAIEARVIAWSLMDSIAFIMVFQSMNSILTKGVLRAGGDTKFLMAGDILFLWVASVPLGALAGLVLHLPAFWIYTFLKIDQVIKCVWCVFRLRSRKWMKKIYGSADAAQARQKTA